MRTLNRLVPLALFAGGVMAQQACNNTVPNGTGLGQFPVAGVIRGNVVYNGPPPCTQNGGVVGNAIVFVFDRRNPPPPSGTATTAVNFGVVSGDALFADIPRTSGATKVCPAAGAANVFVTAPYTIAPMAAGSYVIQAFYDYTGNFLPTFDFRKLPEATDVGGGYIDLGDANKLVPVIPANPIGYGDGGVSIYPTEAQSTNPNYQPIYLPVDVGTLTAPPTQESLRGVGTYTLPPEGYIADNVTVFLGTQLPFARPYFYPEGVAPGTTGNFNGVGAPADGTVDGSLFASAANGPNSIVSNGASTTIPGKVVTPGNPSGTPDYVPVLSYPQDLAVYALPSTAAVNAVPYFQASFPQLNLHFFGDGADQYSAAEQAPAISTSPTDPFHMQLTPALNGNGGVFVFHNQPDVFTAAADNIPEGLVPTLWPLVVLLKLEDDPNHTLDPQSMVVQGADGLKPIVIVQAITISSEYGDSLLDTVELGPGNLPSTAPLPAGNLQDHVTVLLRPAALCLDPNHTDLGGTVVTPYQNGSFPPKDTIDKAQTGTIFNPSIISNPQLSSLVNQSGQGAYYGCLPTGRYQINMVYPTSQAWTTPNEIGGCAASEGSTEATNDPGTCSIKSRPVLRSQGTRAVVEITSAALPGNCNGAAQNAFGSDGKTPITTGPVWATAAGVTTPVPGVPTACTTLPASDFQ